MRALKSLILAAAMLALAACASTGGDSEPGKSDDLDVAQPAPDAPIAQGTTKEGKVPADAVMNWQSFFKAPPTSQERSLLERRVTAWTDVGTVKELLQKGRAELALGRIGAAEVSFRKATRLEPKNLEAALELAALFLKKKDVKNAFEFLVQVKEGLGIDRRATQSFIFRYRYTLALAYIERGDREKGHKVLSDLLTVQRDFAPAYVALATSYITINRDAVAEFVVRRGLDRIKEDPRLLSLMGLVLARRRTLDEARLWYDKALKVSPTYTPALVNRAALAMQNLEYGAAEADLIQALTHEPHNVDALVALGIAQKKQGNISGAKASLTKAVDVSPENAYARFNLAVLLADDLKKPDEALRLFREVLQTEGQGGELKDLARSYVNDLKPTGEAL